MRKLFTEEQRNYLISFYATMTTRIGEVKC